MMLFGSGGVWLLYLPFYIIYSPLVAVGKIFGVDLSKNGLDFSSFAFIPTLLFWIGLELRMLKKRLLI
jgi:hypothetical protein